MAEACGCAYHPIKAKRWPHCRECGRTPDQVASISRRGRCDTCSVAINVAQIREMHAKAGPSWERYVASLRSYSASLTRETTP